MIKSVHKHLIKDGFHVQVKAYIKQLVEHSNKNNLRLTLVVNDACDPLSSYALDCIESTRAKFVTILLREQCSRTILGEVKYSSNKETVFPVSFCILVDKESYLIVKGNEISGFFQEKEAAKLTNSIVNKIQKIFF